MSHVDQHGRPFKPPEKQTFDPDYYNPDGTSKREEREKREKEKQQSSRGQNSIKEEENEMPLEEGLDQIEFNYHDKMIVFKKAGEQVTVGISQRGSQNRLGVILPASELEKLKQWLGGEVQGI